MISLETKLDMLVEAMQCEDIVVLPKENFNECFTVEQKMNKVVFWFNNQEGDTSIVVRNLNNIN